MEERHAEPDRLGRRIQSSEPAQIDTAHEPDAEGNGEGRQPDAELEDPVREHRSPQARGEAGGETGPERETRHVGRENRRHGQLGRAEHEGQLAGPRRLVYQTREARDEEAHEKEREADVHGSGATLSVSGPSRGRARARAVRTACAPDDGARRRGPTKPSRTLPVCSRGRLAFRTRSLAARAS